MGTDEAAGQAAAAEPSGDMDCNWGEGAGTTSAPGALLGGSSVRDRVAEWERDERTPVRERPLEELVGQRGRIRRSNTTTNSNTPRTQPPPQLQAATAAAAVVARPDTRAATEAAAAPVQAAAAQEAQTAAAVAAVAAPAPTPTQISNSFDPLAEVLSW